MQKFGAILAIVAIIFCANLNGESLAQDSRDSGDSSAKDSRDSRDLNAKDSRDSLTIIKPLESAHHFLSIKESYQTALLNNDSIKASQSGIERTKKLKDATFFLFAPQIDLVGNYTYMKKTSIEIPSMSIPAPAAMGALGIHAISTPKMNLNMHENHFAFGIISVMYPLYTGGKRLSALKIADLQIQDSDFIAQLSKITLFEKLVKSYFGVKLSMEVYKTLSEVESGALNHVNNAKKMQENGQIARLEFLGAQVEYDRAKNKAREAKDALDVALLAFKTILQDEKINENVFLKDNGEIANLTLTSELNIAQNPINALQSYKDSTISAYPALKSIEVKKLQAKELSDFEFGSFLPSVGLYGGYVIKNNNTLLNRAIPSWYVGVGARWSILSQSGRIFKYQASKIAQNEADYLHAQAKKDILLLVETTYKEVLSARESYNNLSSTVALASENLKLQEEAFSNGMASSTQVSDARNQLSLAKIEAQNSQYKFVISLAKLYAISNDIEGFWSFY